MPLSHGRGYGGRRWSKTQRCHCGVYRTLNGVSRGCSARNRDGRTYKFGSIPSFSAIRTRSATDTVRIFFITLPR